MRNDKLIDIYRPIVEDLKSVDQCLLDVVTLALDPFPREIGAFRSSGKRLRPALSLFVHRMAAGRESVSQPVIEQAAALELMHIATLIHDDIVDGSYQRRGHQTLHRLFTDKTAVLVGDYLYATAIDRFNRFGSRHAVDVVTRATVGMAHGELMQVLLTPSARSRREIYLDIISKKTADFFAAAAEVGAESAGVSPDRRALFRSFGWNFGMAFQIIDDILDVTASPDNIGKPVFQDLVDGKVTLPSILLLEADARELVMTVLADRKLSDELRAALTDLLQQHDIVPRALREADQYLSDARDVLSSLRSRDDSPSYQSLLSLCDYIIQQNSLPQPSLT